MHALLGFALWAILLSLFYSYLSRFSIAKTQRFFTIVDDGKRDVSWKNAYLLCLAGGISHTLIDMLFHPGHSIDLLAGVNITFDDILTWGEMSYGLSEVLIIFAYVAIIATWLLIIYFLRKELKKVLLFLLALIGSVVLLFYSLSYDLFGERDISVVLFMFVFVFLPLFIVVYVAKDVEKNPIEPSRPLLEKELALKIVATIMLLIASAFFLLGLSGIIAPEIPNALLGDGLSNGTLAIIGVIVMVLSSIGIIGAVGLFFKITLCRYFVIFVCVLLIIFVFPFAIALFLCRADIKEMFVKKLDSAV
jgi:hypothetical protein